MKAKIKTKPSVSRSVVIVDRGWIFAGDIVRKDGRIKLSRCVWVFRWESIGLDGVLKNPDSDNVTLKPIHDVDIPEGSEICCFPVCANWGLK
jgi:hypothetical protein